jgi:hypothetical protein
MRQDDLASLKSAGHATATKCRPGANDTEKNNEDTTECDSTVHDDPISILPGPATLLKRSPDDLATSNSWILRIAASNCATSSSETLAFPLTPNDAPHKENSSTTYSSLSSGLQDSLDRVVQDLLGNNFKVGEDVCVTEIITPFHPGYHEEAANVAIIEEIQGFMDRGTFQMVLYNSATSNANVMGTRIVLALKNYATLLKNLSRRAWSYRVSKSVKVLVLCPKLLPSRYFLCGFFPLFLHSRIGRYGLKTLVRHSCNQNPGFPDVHTLEFQSSCVHASGDFLCCCSSLSTA